jgi:hypothetical protein
MSTKITLDPTLKYSIQGVNNSGKSVLFRHFIKQLLDAKCRVLVYDTEDEWNDPRWAKYKSLIVYKPASPDDVEEFDRKAGQVYDARNTVFAVESIDFFTSAKKGVPPNLKKIIHWGRNKGVGLITTSRLPADVHKNVLGLGAALFLFQVYEPNAIDYLAQIVGKETAQQLPSLKQGEFVMWVQGKATKMNPIKETEP